MSHGPQCQRRWHLGRHPVDAAGSHRTASCPGAGRRHLVVRSPRRPRRGCRGRAVRRGAGSRRDRPQIDTADVGRHARGSVVIFGPTDPGHPAGASSGQRTDPRSIFRSLWIWRRFVEEALGATRSSSGRRGRSVGARTVSAPSRSPQLLLHLLGVRRAVIPLGVELRAFAVWTFFTSFGPKVPSPGSASRSARRASSRQSIEGNVAAAGSLPQSPARSVVVVVWAWVVVVVTVADVVVVVLEVVLVVEVVVGEVVVVTAQGESSTCSSRRRGRRRHRGTAATRPGADRRHLISGQWRAIAGLAALGLVDAVTRSMRSDRSRQRRRRNERRRGGSWWWS